MHRGNSSLYFFLIIAVCSSASTAVEAQPPDVVLPAPLEHPEAPYPPSEMPHAHDATVVLEVTVELDGSVSDPHVVDSAGKAFDDAALAAVATWPFSPGKMGGKVVKARIRVPVHFAAPAAPVEPPPAAPAATPQLPTPETQRPPMTPQPPPEAADRPTEVTVIGRAKAPSTGASSFDFRPEHLKDVPRKNAAAILPSAGPGFLLTNEGGEGHAEQVFLRGFDAREGQDIEFTVGGVPINESGNLHGNGYADTHFILPELVESVHVNEGPFDPRQGNYAVAGSADYELGLEKRGLTAEYTIGSFATNRLLLLWGPEGGSTHTFGGAELYTTDGYGQNRDSKRATAMGQYEGSLGAQGSYRLGLSAYANTYHSAGVLREDDYEAGRVGFYDTYDPLQGGDSSRYSLYGDVEARAGDVVYKQQLFVTYRGMRIRENFTGFLLDVQTPIQNPHPQRGDLLDLDMTEETIGGRGSARLRGKALGQNQELELGYFARGDHVDGTQYRIEQSTGHPYHLDTDLTSKLADLGLYVDAGVRPTSWLTLRGGVRADLFAFDVINNCAVDSVSHPSKTNPPGDASCLSQQDFGNYREPVQRSSTASAAILPRAAVLLGPIRHFVFSADIGKGVRSIDPNYVSQDVKSPFASVIAYEGGVSYANGIPGGALVARSIFFQTKVDKDLIFSETAGRNVLGGGTTRTGWALAARFTGDWVDLSANATFVKSTFDDTGLLVPYVPDVVMRWDGALFGPLPVAVRGDAFQGNLGAGVTYVGHRPLPFGQRSDELFTIDASAKLRWTHYEAGLSVTNLLDRQYRLGEYDFASDFRSDAGAAPTLVPVRHFSAGAPRAIFGTFGVDFGGT